jgi:hypothetical protein
VNDEELAKWLNITPEEAAVIIPRLTPERRAAYERMYDTYNEIVLWEAGVGPPPDGVIMCGPKQVRMGK